VLADGPGERQRAVDVADAVTDTPWEAHMLAVDVRGGTVRARAEGFA
jgi:homoserine kinase